jgi:hypothetical protein
MNNPGKSQKMRFNMQGYMIELDKKNHSWTWQKWEYASSSSGEKRVVRHKGGLEFMKMFRSLLGDTGSNDTLPLISNQQEMATALKKYGVDYIYLYQGETVVEEGFQTVEEAEAFYQLDRCSSWNLTDYWFAYDWNMQSWCMFDTYTGQLEFTPNQAENRLKQNKIKKPLYRQKSNLNQPTNTLH